MKAPIAPADKFSQKTFLGGKSEPRNVLKFSTLHLPLGMKNEEVGQKPFFFFNSFTTLWKSLHVSVHDPENGRLMILPHSQCGCDDQVKLGPGQHVAMG